MNGPPQPSSGGGGERRLVQEIDERERDTQFHRRKAGRSRVRRSFASPVAPDLWLSRVRWSFASPEFHLCVL
ncbi:hypothetical protein HanPI659440_Chr05g0200011 [Helianthus annuus]|nr:hypothetical protein HanPI659440_Chr05g0200011 [Helianthus annuus]